jgi:enoyl-CoA hydratase
VVEPTQATAFSSDGILTVTFTRPEKRNAVSDEMLDVLRAAVDELACTDSQRVLIIRAEGLYFTAGVDLAGGLAQAMRGESAYPGQHFRHVYRGLHRLLDEIEYVEKPVILAAQGPCLGIGLELASSCDFRFAARSAVFSLPEIKLGVMAGSGGTSRLTRLVGPHWAKWIAVAGQPVDATQALTIGLVHAVVEDGELDAYVAQFADSLISLPGEALGLAKIAVDACVDADRVTQRHLERIANTTLFGSPEFTRRTSKFAP